MQAAFMPLPDPVRTVISKAERVAQRTHADALNHDRIPEYGEEEKHAQRRYEELCDSLLVCREFGCFERTEHGRCEAHINNTEGLEVVGYVTSPGASPFGGD